MIRRTHNFSWIGMGASVAVAGFSAGCSSSSSTATGKSMVKPRDAGIIFVNPGGGNSGDSGVFIITPAHPTFTVDPGGPPPTPIQFKVQNADGASIEWVVSNPYLGTIDASGLFTPSGRVGGTGFIEVIVNGKTAAKVEIAVTVAQTQNGSSTPASTDAGAGGLGGVGGEGFGGPVSDAVKQIFTGTPTTSAGLELLYPYDETVFPLDILPPLYQWTAGPPAHFDAVYIHISAPPYYDYKGFFGRPAALGAADNFLRHPIPKDVWAAATNSAAGGTLSVELVLAAGGKAYGPLKQTYKIALAPFNGRIYYQAYATGFVKNSIDSEGSTVWDHKQFGAATLSIDVGAESPKLVAGTDGPGDGTGCRVCHSVSAYGDRMIVQHGDRYEKTSTYDLKNGNVETFYKDVANKTWLYGDNDLRWAGLSPDGSMGLGSSFDVAGSSDPNGGWVTKLYDMNTGAVIPSPGLNEFATKIGLPAFSPDGKHVAFSFFAGPGAAQIGGKNGHQLVTMDFDPVTKTFSGAKKLWDAPGDDQRPAFITFMPDSASIVFQRHWVGTNGNAFASWQGAKSELWWVDVASGKAVPLDRVNGIGADGKLYLPTNSRNHAEDNHLNYEPSISPVASGGYAWMVFMSRRSYGNIATRDPWDSDPRNVDIHGDDPSTKKIWLAAIDLNAKPGTDPSHPAFYIPGQELHGINSRPFFALKPCMSDRGTCATGVDCCSGFCRDGLCHPPEQTSCSQEGERCAAKADCCSSGATCLGGFCETIIQ